MTKQIEEDIVQKTLLLRAFASMQGRADFSFLEDVYVSARQSGFTGTLKLALLLLREFDSVDLEAYHDASTDRLRWKVRWRHPVNAIVDGDDPPAAP